MMKRLAIYFHYDPNGQVDTACLFAVRAVQQVAHTVIFVTNGSLTPTDRDRVQRTGAHLVERENTGYDVGAYRAVLLDLGRDTLAEYDELLLLNYTLAGPVCPLGAMMQAMEARRDLDFWGLTRHYAMRSARFRTAYGAVPEHIQSHFLAVRPKLFLSDAFWQYWRTMRLPQSYEQSVALHEARFTRWFADLGFAWDTYVQTDDLKHIFVNPIMACPQELLAQRGCPFFKRRSFFTPYGDELRRTDGQAGHRLYDYLKTKTDYPVDDLVRSLLQTQPLTALAQNLHWHLLLPPCCDGAAAHCLNLDAAGLQGKTPLQPGRIYCLTLPENVAGVAGGDETANWYWRAAQPDPAAICAAATLFAREPLLGLLGPALPLYPGCAAQRQGDWQKDLPALRRAMRENGLRVPLEESEPLPLPTGGCLLLRAEAFGCLLPPLRAPVDVWLLPLLAQQNGYASMTFETAEQCLARTEVLTCSQAQTRDVKSAAKALARAVKRRWRAKHPTKKEVGD